MLDDESKKRVKDLCDQIAKEQDRNRFSVLVAELNRILETAENRGRNHSSTSTRSLETERS